MAATAGSRAARRDREPRRSSPPPPESASASGRSRIPRRRRRSRRRRLGRAPAGLRPSATIAARETAATGGDAVATPRPPLPPPPQSTAAASRIRSTARPARPASAPLRAAAPEPAAEAVETDSRTAAPSAPPKIPLILPGESLAKYRGDAAARRRSRRRCRPSRDRWSEAQPRLERIRRADSLSPENALPDAPDALRLAEAGPSRSPPVSEPSRSAEVARSLCRSWRRRSRVRRRPAEAGARPKSRPKPTKPRIRHRRP